MVSPKDIAEMVRNDLEKLAQILENKGEDYSGDQDTFHNFKMSAQLTGIPTKTVIFTRMTDKITRLSNLLHKHNKVKDESIDDTLNDLIGYAFLLKSWLKNGGDKIVIYDDDGEY